MIKVPVIPSRRERPSVFWRGHFKRRWRKGWSRIVRLLNASRRDTLNFQVKLHARSVTDTPLVLRITCLSNRKYRLRWKGLAGVIHSWDPCQVFSLPPIIPPSANTSCTSQLFIKNCGPARRWFSFHMIFARRWRKERQDLDFTS